jgi:hypothetical protein
MFYLEELRKPLLIMVILFKLPKSDQNQSCSLLPFHKDKEIYRKIMEKGENKYYKSLATLR